MFDSKVSDWNIVAAHALRKRSFENAGGRVPSPGDSSCSSTIRNWTGTIRITIRAAGAQPAGTTAVPNHGDWNAYLDTYMDGQLTELLTNYGAIGGIWFDGMWDKPDADWHLQKTYSLIHKLQPAALIIPNHHQTPLPGEDVQTFERDLPGQNSAGFNTKFVSDQLPLESSNTLNGAWGFNIGDEQI